MRAQFRHSLHTTITLGLLVTAFPTIRERIQTRRIPSFADFKVDSIFRGHPAPVDLTSDRDAPRFRSALRHGARSGPNFAGHLTVVTWGCGTSCIVVALVDAKTGRVFSTPVNPGYGVEHHLDSRLLIVDRVACTDTTWAASYAHFLEWTGQRLEERDSLPNTDVCKR